MILLRKIISIYRPDNSITATSKSFEYKGKTENVY